VALPYHTHHACFRHDSAFGYRFVRLVARTYTAANSGRRRRDVALNTWLFALDDDAPPRRWLWRRQHERPSRHDIHILPSAMPTCLLPHAHASPPTTAPLRYIKQRLFLLDCMVSPLSYAACAARIRVRGALQRCGRRARGCDRTNDAACCAALQTTAASGSPSLPLTAVLRRCLLWRACCRRCAAPHSAAN